MQPTREAPLRRGDLLGFDLRSERSRDPPPERGDLGETLGQRDGYAVFGKARSTAR